MFSPALLQFSHAQEDTAMLFDTEIGGVESARYQREHRIIEEDRSQYELLGFDVGRQTPLKS